MKLSYDIFRKIFVIKKFKFFFIYERKLYNNFSVLPYIFSNKEFYIYNGKNWNKRFILKWMVGFKIGEFKWSRKIACLKKKKKKK